MITAAAQVFGPQPTGWLQAGLRFEPAALVVQALAPQADV